MRQRSWSNLFVFFLLCDDLRDVPMLNALARHRSDLAAARSTSRAALQSALALPTLAMNKPSTTMKPSKLVQTLPKSKSTLRQVSTRRKNPYVHISFLSGRLAVACLILLSCSRNFTCKMPSLLPKQPSFLAPVLNPPDLMPLVARGQWHPLPKPQSCHTFPHRMQQALSRSMNRSTLKSATRIPAPTSGSAIPSRTRPAWAMTWTRTMRTGLPASTKTTVNRA